VRVKTRSSIILSAIFAFIVPALVLVTLVAVSDGMRRDALRGEIVDYISMLVSAIVGFIFLVREWRVWALPMSFVYFPVMWFLLNGVGLAAACGIHGRCL
jgi:hypothetical protein